MALVLLVISVSMNIAEGLFIKKYNTKHKEGGFLFTALVCLFVMTFFLLTDRNGFHIPASMYGYSAVAAILYSGASLLTYIALGSGSFAMSMLILSYSSVFSIGYGILFLDEPVTTTFCIGLMCVLVSLYLVRGKTDQAEPLFSTKWLVCILLSTVGSGMFGVVSRMQQIHFNNVCSNEFMVVALGLATAVLFTVGMIRDRKNLRYILKKGSGYAALAGTANGASNLLNLAVNMLIPISIAAPTGAGMKILLSFLISRLVFREQFLTRQVVGVIVGTLGLIALNL